MLSFYFISAKILLAGGGNVVPDITQVIDLADPSKTCQPLEKLEFDMHTGAAYGLLDNSYPIFCGGQFEGNDTTLGHCWVLQHSNITKIPMDQARGFAGGVVIGTKQLWVAGGIARNGSLLQSTIFVTLDGHSPGPDLPNSNAKFCFLNNRGSNFFMIGGLHDYSSFQILHGLKSKWVAGPKMPIAIEDGITCTLNYYYGDFAIIIVGGTRPGHSDGLDDKIDAIQVFSLSKNEWLEGKDGLLGQNYVGNFFVNCS